MKVNKQEALKRMKKPIFIDSVDKYADEYEQWKKTNVIKRLIGVFEVPAEQFNTVDTADMLRYLGLSNYEVVKYVSEFDAPIHRGSEDVAGAGCACALRDQYGRIRPAVFIRNEVLDQKNEVGANNRAEFEATVRLLVLMHELGHAEDIVKQVNYNNVTMKVNVLDAEVYAHRFVCTNAKRLGYRLTLSTYLNSLEKSLTAEDDVSRWAAERALKELNLEEYREAAKPLDMSDTRAFKQQLEACGRFDEVMKKINERNKNKPR